MRTRLFSLAVLLGCLVTSCAPKTVERTVWMPVDAATGDVPAFVLWARSGNPLPVEAGMPVNEAGLIVAAWKDGRVVFSHDSDDGGPPFAERRVEPSVVSSIQHQAWAAVDGLDLRAWAMPCSSDTQIFIAGDNRSQVLTSAFDMKPYDDRVIFTDHGLESLDGRDPQKVMREQPSSFRAFVSGWAKAAGAMRSLIDTSVAPRPDDPTRFERITVHARK